MRYLAPVLMLFALVACAPLGEKLATLRKESPAGDNYNQLLATEYLAYSESLAERGHPIRADRFAAKGLAAQKGETVLPEQSLKLDAERQALMLVLTDDVKEVAPDKLARAQLLFDCLADEVGSAGVSPTEALCKESFETALTDVEFIADTLVHGTNNQFAVQFSPASAVLSNEASSVIDIVASRVKNLGEYKVELMAYANRPDMPSKIKLLASKRVLAIEEALIKKGVNAAHIHSHPYVQNSEVFLSVSDTGSNENAVGVTIQTFGQPAEAKAK